MALFKRVLLLILFCSSFLSDAFADYYLRNFRSIELSVKCNLVMVDVFFDGNNDDPSDDNYVGTMSMLVGDGCRQGIASGNGLDDFTVAPISKEQVEVAISPKPVEGDSLSIDYKGYEFKHGDIIGMDSEDPRLDLIEGGYDLNGEETVDISKLTPGFYFLLLENDEQRATVKFQVK